MRLLVVWCPDWPVTAACVAAGVAVHHPAAVFSANRVVACSAVARRNGVRRGMRRREAQACCPELAVLGVDPARDVRLFEPVAAAVEDLVVGVDVVRAGVVAVPVDGALSYFRRRWARGGGWEHFRGEHELIERLVDHVSVQAGVEVQAGIADGLFAAVLAARRSAIVAAGRNAEFLAPLPITELQCDITPATHPPRTPPRPDEDGGELVDLLRRLGLRTLGQFAELSERTVTSRFGRAGLHAHRLAQGRSERPLARRRPTEELVVTEEFDPPIDRIDTAAFVARKLAERLHAELITRDLACTRLGIYAVTESAEELARVWRCAEPVTAQGIADRVRWQFDSWLQGEQRPSSGVVKLRLEPDELVDASALQLQMWRIGGADDAADERAARALVHVQGLLGPEGVVTPVLAGGRGPADRVRFVPWGDPREDDDDGRPWPGRLPAPSPATVFTGPVRATVVDRRGSPVGLTERNRLSGSPYRVAVDGGEARPVVGWAGPWPLDERWWAAVSDGPKARVQVVRDTGEALLLLYRAQQSPQWIVEGEYT